MASNSFRRDFEFGAGDLLWVQARLKSCLWSRQTTIWTYFVLVGFAILVVAIPGLGTYFLLKTAGLTEPLAGIVGLAAVIGGYFVYSKSWPLLNAMIGRRFALLTLPDYHSAEIEITESGLAWRTEHSKTKVSWPGVLAIRVFPEGILFVLGLNALFLPIIVIEGDESPDEIAAEWEEWRVAATHAIDK